MELKYTTDGRKVVVIGNLNAQEKIVQEVFVSGDTELPSGENFVVKSLHDKPVESWLSREQKNIEKLIESLKKERDLIWDEVRGRQSKLNIERAHMKEKLNFILGAQKKVSLETFEPLINLICGETKWIVFEGYSPELVQLDSVPEGCNCEKENLRLISIFGKTGGDMTYGLGTYSDSSGSNRKFKPFSDYEHAKSYLLFLINQGKLTEANITELRKHNIPIPADKLAEYKEVQIANFKKNAEQSRNNADAYDEKIKEIESIQQ